MTEIIWLFRKKRALGNFSIENSFAEVLKSWGGSTNPTWLEAASYSNGFINRLRIIKETSKLRSNILHITGDINFASLAWPKWRSRRPKIILTIHDIGALQEQNAANEWLVKKVWLDWPLKCIDHLIVVSDQTKSEVLQAAPWFPASMISVIPSVVPQHFKERNARPQNDPPVALQVGLAPNKNLRNHVRAIRDKNIHLRIIGEPDVDELEWLESSGANFSWTSRLTNDQMQSEYANADFLLFASTLEGFGMPIIEAQMVGLPVITSDRNPMRQVAGKGALLCNPMDVHSIAEQVENLLQSPNVRSELVEAGFKNAARYSPESSAKALLQVYESI